jgi:hypothetical protein
MAAGIAQNDNFKAFIADAPLPLAVITSFPVMAAIRRG